MREKRRSMKVQYYVPTAIVELKLPVRDMLVLTVVNLRQRTPESLSARKIANALKVSVPTVNRSLRSLKDKKLISERLETSIDNRKKGLILHLYQDAHNIEELSLNEKMLLSLLMEDWALGYFKMLNRTIKERLGLSSDSVRRYFSKFEKRKWIRVEDGFYNNGPILTADSIKKYRKVYCMHEAIRSAATQLTKGVAIISAGNLRRLEETIRIEDSCLLNHWVHKRGLSNQETFIRYITADNICKFILIGEWYGFKMELEISHQELWQFHRYCNAYKDYQKELISIYLLWFSGKLQVGKSIDPKVQEQFQQGVRSVSLFMNPRVTSLVSPTSISLSADEKECLANELATFHKSKGFEEVIESREKRAA
jgi:Mn-dependent DtxR family transcriptional regulator